MPKVTIAGEVIEADDQESLKLAIDAYKSRASKQTSSTPKKPKPVVKSTQSNKVEKPKRLSPDEIKAAMKEDVGQALVKILNGELGFDIMQTLQQAIGFSQLAMRNASLSSVQLALERNNIPVTDANVTELLQITQASQGENASLTLGSLDKAAKEAVEEGWLTAEKSKKSEKSEKPENVTEMPFPDTKKKTKDVDEIDSDDDVTDSFANEEDVEKVMSEMKEEDILELLSSAEKG